MAPAAQPGHKSTNTSENTGGEPPPGWTSPRRRTGARPEESSNSGDVSRGAAQDTRVTQAHALGGTHVAHGMPAGHGTSEGRQHERAQGKRGEQRRQPQGTHGEQDDAGRTTQWHRMRSGHSKVWGTCVYVGAYDTVTATEEAQRAGHTPGARTREGMSRQGTRQQGARRERGNNIRIYQGKSGGGDMAA